MGLKKCFAGFLKGTQKASTEGSWSTPCWPSGELKSATESLGGSLLQFLLRSYRTPRKKSMQEPKFHIPCKMLRRWQQCINGSRAPRGTWQECTRTTGGTLQGANKTRQDCSRKRAGPRQECCSDVQGCIERKTQADCRSGVGRSKLAGPKAGRWDLLANG